MLQWRVTILRHGWHAGRCRLSRTHARTHDTHARTHTHAHIHAHAHTRAHIYIRTHIAVQPQYTTHRHCVAYLVRYTTVVLQNNCSIFVAPRHPFPSSLSVVVFSDPFCRHSTMCPSPFSIQPSSFGGKRHSIVYLYMAIEPILEHWQ